MNKKLVLVFIICLLIFFGCSGSIDVEMPVARSINNAETFNIPYDIAWRTTVGWYANNNIIIDKLDKDSGLITAKYGMSIGSRFIDCGDVRPSKLARVRRFDRVVSLNTVIFKVPENSIRIRVNLFGEVFVEAFDTGWGKNLSYSGKCYSTGVLERSLFGELREVSIKK